MWLKKLNYFVLTTYKIMMLNIFHIIIYRFNCHGFLTRG